MRVRVLAIWITLIVLASLATTAALAKGVNPPQLSRAGWTCFNAGPNNWVHCVPPGSGASSATMSVRVFDTQDVNDAEAEFLGTELLIHVDLFHEQPCPQDESGEYEDLRETPAPLPYFACHHFDTEHH
jgi:hypothetical protein